MVQPFSRGLRLRGKGPVLDHTQTSYPMLVRDGILTRIQAMAAFAGFDFDTNNAMQVQPEHVPHCGCYLLQEQMTPDGDANAGEVRFSTVAVIGISVIIQDNNAEDAEKLLDYYSQQLMRRLFTDHTLYDNSVFKIEAFTAGTRTHHFGNMLKDQETPIAELRLQLNVDLGVITHEPQITDDLEVIATRTAWPPGGTAQQIHDTIQVYAVYDLETQEE